MRNQQEQRQNLIEQFVEKWKHSRNDWKSRTAYHFMDQGFPKSTIYSVLNPFERTGSNERKRGSERKAIQIILRKREVLRRAANHKTGISQQKFAVRFGHVASYIVYICRTIRRLKIMCRKRVKVPKYKDIAAII